MSIKTEMKLAGSRKGRVILHLAAFAKDLRFGWHLDGIVRELKGV